jgi:hypothetical protein
MATHFDSCARGGRARLVELQDRFTDGAHDDVGENFTALPRFPVEYFGGRQPWKSHIPCLLPIRGWKVKQHYAGQLPETQSNPWGGGSGVSLPARPMVQKARESHP